MLLVIGRIGRAHGLRGEVSVESRTDQPDLRFSVGTKLATNPPDRGPLIVDSYRQHNGVVLLSFQGKTDRSAAESLRNTTLIADIEIPRSNQGSDEFHISQIVGLIAKDNSGNTLGEVIDVLDRPAHDTLVVATPKGEMLVPFVAKHVPVIDLEKSELLIANFEGILLKLLQ